ncbi:MAG: hypothetical protein ABI085_17375, partial [Gemmatimonadaceae bacterium]
MESTGAALGYRELTTDRHGLTVTSRRYITACARPIPQCAGAIPIASREGERDPLRGDSNGDGQEVDNASAESDRNDSRRETSLGDAERWD